MVRLSESVYFISAILLAAGEARRLGRPKLLLPVAGSTVLERTLDNLLNSRVSEVILVLGDRAREMREVVAGRKVKLVFNPDFSRGMSTSLITGLKQVDPRAQRVMVVLADQPLITKDIYNRLIAESLGCDRGIVVPVYRGKRGNPVLFSMKYKEELLRLEGDVGGRQIVAEHSEDTLEVDIDSESINIDIDTLDDYFSRLI